MSRGTVTPIKPRRRGGRGVVPDLMAKLREAEIRTRLRQARDEAGMSRAQLADILTVHPKSIENYETDRVPWSLINAWAAATGTSVEYLLHGVEPGEPGTGLGMSDSPQLAEIVSLLEEIRDELVRRPALTSEQVAALDALARLGEAGPMQQRDSSEPRADGPAVQG